MASESQYKQLQKELVDKFNTVVMGMIDHIIDYYSEADMCKFRVITEHIINKTPEGPISGFIMHIYKNDEYRKNILNRDESFFIREADVKMNQEEKNGNNAAVSRLFEFKQIWGKIDDDTKEFIKKSMIVLVKISQKYILSL